MSLNLNWYKSYDTKRKNSKNANLCFWTKLQKNRNGNISILSHNFWTNQNLLEFRPVKHVIMTVWTSVLWKKNIHISKKWPELVITRSFIKRHSFPISRYARWVWTLDQTNKHMLLKMRETDNATCFFNLLGRLCRWVILTILGCCLSYQFNCTLKVEKFNMIKVRNSKQAQCCFWFWPISLDQSHSW